MESFKGWLCEIGEKFGISRQIQLSAFQKAKLLHEFRTFYDINKDGKLQWADFQLARDFICSKSGWKPNSLKWEHCRQLFIDLWRNLMDTADDDVNGEITENEWLSLWLKILRQKSDNEKKIKSLLSTRQKDADTSAEKDSTIDYLRGSYIPSWFENYVQYKFNLLDRTGDGVIEADEFEYTLNDAFGISPADCRVAFCMISQNNVKVVDLAYFRNLALQFYLSDDPSDLGNFVNGKLVYDY